MEYKDTISKEGKAIAKFLKRKDLDNQLVWDILTALRGPDSVNSYLKQITTELIRSWLGIENGKFRVISSGPDKKEFAEFRRNGIASQGMATEGHYISHCKKAFKALGLKWDEVNE